MKKQNDFSWVSLLDRAAAPDCAKPRAELVSAAREAQAQPLVRRVYRFEDLGQHRTVLSGMSRYLPGERREKFALAMSDHTANIILAGELPLLAAAFYLTRDPAVLQRVIDQLEEMAGWTSLQRPGWILACLDVKLPPDGKDGNWLGTGTGVRAIADALEILPGDSVPVRLVAKINTLLEREIESIVEDWQTKRTWFVRENNPISNQWVLPTEGLVRACLVVGREKHRDEYEIGVGNLLIALDAHGPAGEFEEGLKYANFTVTSMVHAARAMALAGDRRAIDHPFLKRFPTWFVHHLQPGGFLINAFDAVATGRGDAGKMRTLLALLACFLKSDVAAWALADYLKGPVEDIAGLVAHVVRPNSYLAPPLYASYKRATRVNWRDTWDENGSGLWIRGGHPTDQHDHQDRGHVNYSAGGRPILIEAGTPPYEDPRIGSHYKSGAGHNVLQLGPVLPKKPGRAPAFQIPAGWQPLKTVAPIKLNRLDALGGDVVVRVNAQYDGLQTWQREVGWTADALTVRDAVSLVEGREDIILFYWHLGVEQAVEITEGERNYRVRWPGTELVIEADNDLELTQLRMPDHTLATDGSEHLHTCLVVRSGKPLDHICIQTSVAVG